MSEGFKTGDSFCKNQDGKLVTDIKCSLDHFNAILNADDTNNFANDMIKPSRPNTLDNATPVVPSYREEVAIAIQRHKFNKASVGLPAELFKARPRPQFTNLTYMGGTSSRL